MSNMKRSRNLTTLQGGTVLLRVPPPHNNNLGGKMTGNRIGGMKAAATNKARHGEGFYARIGRRGGQNGHTGGFNSDKVSKDGLTGFERAKIAGAKGGKAKTGSRHFWHLLDAQADEIMRLYKDEVPKTRIAKRFGVSSWVLGSWMRDRYGI